MFIHDVAIDHKIIIFLHLTVFIGRAINVARLRNYVQVNNVLNFVLLIFLLSERHDIVEITYLCNARLILLY